METIASLYAQVIVTRWQIDFEVSRTVAVVRMDGINNDDLARGYTDAAGDYMQVSLPIPHRAFWRKLQICSLHSDGKR